MSHYHDETNRILTKWLSKTEYHSMLTVKFNKKNSKMPVKIQNEENLKLIDSLLRNINHYVYKKKYEERNEYLTGLLSIEKNVKKSANQFHVHILLNKDDRISRFKITDILSIAIKSSQNLTNTNHEKCFVHNNIRETINKDKIKGLETDCMHIIEPYNHYAADYVVKTVSSLKFDQIKFLSCNGLSDSDLSFMKNKNLW